MRILLILLLVISLSACGTRKRAVEMEKIKSDLSIFKQNNLITNATVTVTEIGTTYTPIDPKVPMVLPDGRISTNAKIEDKKKTEDSVSKVEDKGTEIIKDKGTKKTKAIDLETKKANPYLWIYITIGTVAALFLVYRYVVKR